MVGGDALAILQRGDPLRSLVQRLLNAAQKPPIGRFEDILHLDRAVGRDGERDYNPRHGIGSSHFTLSAMKRLKLVGAPSASKRAGVS